jgi:hypothetical protein
MISGSTISGIRPMRTSLAWLIPAVVVALAVARVSVWVQPHFAPVVLFPSLIGAALGALLCGLLQLARLRDWRMAVIGTILVAVLAAAAEHMFFYLDRHNEQIRQALEAGIPEETFSRATFFEYMRGEAEQDDRKILLWIVNATATVVSAAAVVIWYERSRHVDESLRSQIRRGEDSRSRLGETRPHDPSGTNP